MLTRSIRATRRFRASPERVFAAWIDPVLARRWLFATASCPIAAVELDVRPGGSFRFVDRRGGAMVEYHGEYLIVDPPRRLTFTLSLEGHAPALTHVVVAIERTPHGALLALVHEHVPRECARDVEGRWCGMLYGLAETLDSTPVVREPRTRRSPPLSPTAAYRSAP